MRRAGHGPALGLPPLDSSRASTFDLALGFRRLAILDLSPAGHQPMASPDGRSWLIFNGEIYNYIELRAELARARAPLPYRLRHRSDPGRLAQWGPECVRRFNGMWAFALWDSVARSYLYPATASA